MACIVLQNAGPSAGESGPEGPCEPFVQASRSASKIKEVRIWPGDSSPWWTARHRSGCSWRRSDPSWRGMIFLLLVAVWVTDESVKVRPDAVPVAQAPRMRLSAAGGECVAAQIVVRGPVKALSAA